MNLIDIDFPELPTFKGQWYAIYLEPVIGSGERLTIANAAIGGDGQAKVIQAIRPELLDCLYGEKADNMQSLIDWVVQSAQAHLCNTHTMTDWKPPFGGVFTSNSNDALDADIDGILKQSTMLSSSLGNIAMDAKRSTEESFGKKQGDRFAKSIRGEMEQVNNRLLSGFGTKVKLSSIDISTTMGFLNDRYMANFAVMSPSNVTGSLQSIKSKMFDSLKMLEECATKDNMSLFRANNAKDVALHINSLAA